MSLFRRFLDGVLGTPRMRIPEKPYRKRTDKNELMVNQDRS
jgi:hypothetical protein